MRVIKILRAVASESNYVFLYRRAIRNFEKCAKPGGLLLIDHRNYDYIINTGYTPSKCIYYNVITIFILNLTSLCLKRRLILNLKKSRLTFESIRQPCFINWCLSILVNLKFKGSCLFLEQTHDWYKNFSTLRIWKTLDGYDGLFNRLHWLLRERRERGKSSNRRLH